MAQTFGSRWTRLIAAALLAIPALGQAQGGATISGTVSERGSNNPLERAQVSIVGKAIAVATDAKGGFTLRGVDAGTVTVRAQYIGYEAREQVVQVTANGTLRVNFALSRTAVTLSGVMVTATGEERRRSVGTAMATVDTAQIERSAATNTQQLLAGSTPGVTVLANGGQPGSGATVRLRGVNSVSMGNSPLIYVDGVRVYGGNTPTNVGGRQFSSPLNDIAAEDIDHIEIVKGPAATTLYGTEASGGVLQIFTKQGVEGAPRWNLSVTSGYNNMGHVGPASDTTGLYINSCAGIHVMNDSARTKFQDASCPASGSWLSNGPIQRTSISVRGGSSNGTTYDLSVTGNNERGVLPVGGSYIRSFRMNIGFKPAKGFTIGFNQSFVNNRSVGFPDGNSSNGVMLNISRGSGSNFKGPGCADLTIVCVLNDSLFTSQVTNTTNHFVTGASLTYQPFDAWTTRLTLGFDYNNADIQYITPFGHLRVPLGQMYQTLWTRQFLSADLASTYRKQLATNWSSATAVGGQVFENRVYSTDLQSDNFAGPGDPTLLSGSLKQITGVTQQRVINAGYFAQETIGWRDVLFVTIGARADGNSAFGKSFGIQTYPKISASYVISDESFWPRRWIETLKLRGAIGDAGKAPGAFDAVRTWTPVAAEGGKPAFATNQIGNPNLGPERTREIELGFDASALNGRVNLQYTHFDQHTYQALIPVQQAPSLGFAGSQLINAGDLMNSGHEVQLNVDIFRSRNVDVSTRIGYMQLHSEAGNIGGVPLTIFALGRTYVVQGLPIPSYYGPKVMNPTEFANPVIQQNQDLGSAFANRIWSPGISVKLFRRVTVDAQGEWQLGGHNLNALAYQNANLNSWQPCFNAQDQMRKAAAGDSSGLATINALDRARCTINTKIARDYGFFVEANDFFKLRSVSVTYDLPKSILRFGARSGSLAFAGRNLFTSTKYTGTDPEVSDQRDDQFARRDYYVFPTSRSFTMTLRLGF